MEKAETKGFGQSTVKHRSSREFWQGQVSVDIPPFANVPNPPSNRAGANLVTRKQQCALSIRTTQTSGCTADGIISQIRRQPRLGLFEAPFFSGSIVLDLVATDPADAEIACLRMAEIPTAD